MRQILAPPWAEPTWWPELETWTAATLAELGLTPSGPVTLFRRRSWSITLTVDTDRGRYWIKQNSPTQAFEARLLRALAQAAPDRVLVPLAVEEASGRMLTADQGPTLRDRGRVDADTWTQLLVDYARLQRESAPALSADPLGLTVIEPAVADDYVARWTAYWAGLNDGDPARLPAEEATRLGQLGPRIRDWSQRLLALGLPITVEHSDLHPNNAFLPIVPGGPPRVFDFGDATLGHPLCSLLVPVRALADPAESGVIGEDATRRVIDAYLEVWSDLAPMTALRAAVPAALNLGILSRHESWQRCIPYEDPEAPQPADFAAAPARWLSMLGHPLD